MYIISTKIRETQNQIAREAFSKLKISDVFSSY